MVEVTFKWRSTSEIPTNKDLPILCMTENKKLIVFKNTKCEYKCGGKPVVCSSFPGFVNDYKIKCWVYQYEIIN